MADQTRQPRKGNQETSPGDESFTPVGAMALMLGYIAIFAILWGLVYFQDLLGRR